MSDGIAKLRVLVVDDDDAVRKSIRYFLEQHGYDVVEASDGEVGISLQMSTPFDIAVIDMMMPNKDGIEVIKELRPIFPDLAILAMSGASSQAKMNYFEVARAFGASATLKKPFGGGDLLDVLDKLEVLNELASA